MDTAGRDPGMRKVVFEDLDFLLRIRHGIKDREERKELMRQGSPLTGLRLLVKAPVPLLVVPSVEGLRRRS